MRLFFEKSDVRFLKFFTPQWRRI